jgi:hypothetical protein
MGWLVSSIGTRAASQRRFSTPFAGVRPVSAWKARLNWRGECCAQDCSRSAGRQDCLAYRGTV